MNQIMKEIPESERPYEKCIREGEGSLSDSELLAVILRTGTRGSNSLTLANDILKQYILNGCAINEKRLIALKKTVGIQTKMLACTLEVEEEDILKAVSLE